LYYTASDIATSVGVMILKKDYQMLYLLHKILMHLDKNPIDNFTSGSRKL